MSDQWYCLLDGQKIGPVKFSRLQQLVEAGRLRADDYVRPVAQEQWSTAREIADLIPTPEMTAPMMTAEPNPETRRSAATIPRAKAISETEEITIAAPRKKKAPATEIPKGSAVAPAKIEVVPTPPKPTADDGLPFIITTEPKATKSSARQKANEPKPLGQRTPGKKSSKNGPLLVGGGAIVAILATALLLVLTGVIDFSSPAVPTATANAAAKLQPIVGGEEDNPTTEAETQDADRLAKPTARKGAAKTDKAALLTSVKQFVDISKFKQVSVSPAIAITGLWLSGSEAGEPFVATPEQPAARFLIVKVKIDNARGAAPLNYQGWGNTAVLYDDADQAIQPLPPDKSPEGITKQRLDAGESLVDTLVFPLVNVEFEKLRLAVPHSTVGIKDDKCFGLELPRRALGRGLDTKYAGANTAVNARVSSGAAAAIADMNPVAAPVVAPVTGAEPALATVAAPAKPAVAKDKNDDDDFLDKLKAKADERDKMEQKK